MNKETDETLYSPASKGKDSKGAISMNRRMELAQAIDAGSRALESLKKAKKKLGSAGGWGLFDLFGGKHLSALIKHGKVASAMECVEKAREDLRIFERELRDVRVSGALDVDVSDFLTFADFFFDGAIADFLVQRRISKSKKNVKEAIRKTEKLLDQLKEIYAGMP